jgi:dTDP-4-amino-4,6-dideoxygalactose transaminase
VALNTGILVVPSSSNQFTDVRYDFMMGKIDKYHWVDVGSSYVPNELSCAVLWAQLEQVHSIGQRRLANFCAYRDGLVELARAGAFRIPAIPKECETNAHIFYLLLPSEAVRQHYEAELKRRGVAAYTHYVALHSAPAGKPDLCYWSISCPR